jgi:hypothetical protein
MATKMSGHETDPIKYIRIHTAQASIKDVQTTREAFSPPKQNIQTSKHDISLFFIFLWIIFVLLDPNPLTLLDLNPIRIRNTATMSLCF